MKNQSTTMMSGLLGLALLPGLALGNQGIGGNNTHEASMMSPDTANTVGGWSVKPLITVGELGKNGKTDVNAKQLGYSIPGILDGTGAVRLDEKTVRVWVNHEFPATAGYPFPAGTGELTGARVSYVDINVNSRKAYGSGLAHHTIYNRAGEVVNGPSDLEYGGINRLCSANLFEAGQFGLEDTIFFTGEETSGGTEFALDCFGGELWAAPMMGRAAWESVTMLENFGTDKVVVLIGDDRGGAPLLLYIGDKGAAPASGYSPADFLVRNGLGLGALYVWVADSGETDPEDWNGTGTSRTGTFVKIPHYDPAKAGTPGYDEFGFADQGPQDLLAAGVGAFQFSRPEDVATDPADGTRAVMASTGRSSLFPSDAWGTTYIIDVSGLSFALLSQDLASIDNIAAEISVIYDGDDAGAGQFAGPDFGLRSPDNLEWADDGLIYLQEDRSVGGFGLTSGIEASVWQLDPVSGVLTRILEMDRSAVPFGQTDNDPNDIGDWESSGILDVSTLFDEAPGTLLLFDVQAHSLRDGLVGDQNLVQGGQLSLLSKPE